MTRRVQKLLILSLLMTLNRALAVEKEYTHRNRVPQEWTSTPSFDAHEPADFDAYWAAKLAALPAPVRSWNGGAIDLGEEGSGLGEIRWNGATAALKKPLLIHLPSAGAPPTVGCFPMDERFIVASAMAGTNHYDRVTWARGQITAARNIQGPTSIYHQFGGHADDGWWQRGKEWLATKRYP